MPGQQQAGADPLAGSRRRMGNFVFQWSASCAHVSNLLGYSIERRNQPGSLVPGGNKRHYFKSVKGLGLTDCNAGVNLYCVRHFSQNCNDRTGNPRIAPRSVPKCPMFIMVSSSESV